MYDQDHRFYSLDDLKTGLYSQPRKGFRDYLLCARCETHCSLFESKAAPFFSACHPPSQPPRKSVDVQLDYKNFRLFLLSVLWRSSITEHPFFEHVDLGPHEEVLRQMLLQSDPGDPDQYGCTVCRLKFQGQDFRDFAVQPTPARPNGHNIYRFTYAGFVFFYYISRHALSLGARRSFIQRNGQMVLMDGHLEELTFLRDTWNQSCKIKVKYGSVLRKT